MVSQCVISFCFPYGLLTPAFSTLAFLTVSHFPLTNFQSPHVVKNKTDIWIVHSHFNTRYDITSTGHGQVQKLHDEAQQKKTTGEFNTVLSVRYIPLPNRPQKSQKRSETNNAST